MSDEKMTIEFEMSDVNPEAVRLITGSNGWLPQPEFFGKPEGDERLNPAQRYFRHCSDSLWRVTKVSEPVAPFVPRPMRLERLVA